MLNDISRWLMSDPLALAHYAFLFVCGGALAVLIDGICNSSDE